MKYLALLLLISVGCTTSVQDDCNCTYVQYDRNELTNGVWKETYTSNWDFHPCEVGVLDKTTFTDFEGKEWKTRTNIECR